MTIMDKDKLEQEFLQELQAREFFQWKNCLTDNETRKWVDLLLEQIENDIIEIDELKQELEDQLFYKTFFGYVVIFLFCFFVCVLFKFFIFS